MKKVVSRRATSIMSVLFNFKTATVRTNSESTLRSFRLLLCFVSPFVEKPEMLRCLCFFSLLSSSGIRRRTCKRRRTGHGSEPCSDDPFATGKSETKFAKHFLYK